MAGVGRPPKDPSRRARRNRDPLQLRVVEAVPTVQPPLPTFYVEHVVKDPEGGSTVVKRRFTWPAATRNWWAVLAQHPLAPEFTDLDWAYLTETALIHAHFWKGDTRNASELRLREAKYGFTPEDRARLRLQFAVADSAEMDARDKREARGEGRTPASARDRMRGVRLKALG